jgi:hypothetical protein
MGTTARWEDLFKKGLLVLLHVSCWPALIRLMVRDLGLTPEEEKAVDRAMNLGSHRLVPPGTLTPFNSNTTRADVVCARYGLTFDAFSRCHYIPADRVAIVREKLSTIQAERRDLVEKFIADYPMLREKQIPAIYEALTAVCKNQGAVERAMVRVISCYPSVADLRGAFTLRFSFLTISTPASDAAEAAAAEGAGQITDTVRGMVSSLRADISDKIAAVIKVASSGGKLHGKTINTTRDALDRAEDLNRIVEDSTLATQINVLRRLLSDAESGVDAAALVPTLQAAETALTADLAAATIAAVDSLTGVGNRRIG